MEVSKARPEGAMRKAWAAKTGTPEASPREAGTTETRPWADGGETGAAAHPAEARATHATSKSTREAASHTATTATEAASHSAVATAEAATTTEAASAVPSTSASASAAAPTAASAAKSGRSQGKRSHDRARDK